MLEDFIQSNSLKAKVVNYLAKGSIIKCRLFHSDKGDLMAVAWEKGKISEEKLAKAAGASWVKRIPFDNVEEMTGYIPLFLPPISVYGVRVVLDSKLSKQETLNCPVSEDKTLKISAKEILEANEEALEADVTG